MFILSVDGVEQGQSGSDRQTFSAVESEDDPDSADVEMGVSFLDPLIDKGLTNFQINILFCCRSRDETVVKACGLSILLCRRRSVLDKMSDSSSK